MRAVGSADELQTALADCPCRECMRKLQGKTRPVQGGGRTTGDQASQPRVVRALGIRDPSPAAPSPP